MGLYMGKILELYRDNEKENGNYKILNLFHVAVAFSFRAAITSLKGQGLKKNALSNPADSPATQVLLGF